MDASFPAPRQTLNYLRGLLQRNRLSPKNKLGQNFLIDLNLLDLIVKTAELTKNDLVLEIGTGTGSLTSLLADHAGSVVTVEIDPAFYELAKDVLAERSNVRQVHSDALRNKNTLHPRVLAAIDEARNATGLTSIKLVANLPYAVATPVISNLLLTDLPIERMVVMVQWEIGERLTARPNTKDYGALSILVQSIAEVAIIRRLPPRAFWPMPKVDSAIVCIRPNAEKRRQLPSAQAFRDFLRDLYVHRRKNLRGALVSMKGRNYEKATVDAKLAELGVDGSARAESLDIDWHRRLCESFGSPTP